MTYLRGLSRWRLKSQLLRQNVYDNVFSLVRKKGGRSTIARKAAVVQKPPTIAPERALRALTEQLEALQKLKGRHYQEADAEETEWTHLTQSIIEGAFGDPSSSLDRFFAASHAGSNFPGGTRSAEAEYQHRFDARVKEFDALIRGLISSLRLQLPEDEIKGVYEPGDQYGFYRDLSSLIATAAREVFIVDAYLDEQVFNLYVDKVPVGATVRILSNKISTNVDTVAKKYATSRPLELRSTADVHDRMLFIDQRGWVIGQSIKDAARKKPTYLIELEEPSLTSERDIHNKIWSAATSVDLTYEQRPPARAP